MFSSRFTSPLPLHLFHVCIIHRTYILWFCLHYPSSSLRTRAIADADNLAKPEPFQSGKPFFCCRYRSRAILATLSVSCVTERDTYVLKYFVLLKIFCVRHFCGLSQPQKYLTMKNFLKYTMYFRCVVDEHGHCRKMVEERTGARARAVSDWQGSAKLQLEIFEGYHFRGWLKC